VSGALRVGTSGYQYRHWRGSFYPKALASKHWFEHYAAHFDTVEINNTFYRLPEAAVFDHWRAAAPAGFLYAVKFSRYGSHMRKLREPASSLRPFMERAERLGSSLGPILVQLPPHWGVDPGRLEEFLRALPKERRFAFEFRDESWLQPLVFDLLGAHGAALCVHDLLPDHPREPTTDWVYLRFHGTGPGHAGGYSPQKLGAEARRIRRHLAAGRDVFAYFNNDVGGHAPRDAVALRRYVEDG
jgi:uncharacterized protein YecE (DUF72 family)